MITSKVQTPGQQRRSQRVLLSIAILVSGQRGNKSPFSERTKTQVVNAHGALIGLQEPVQVGQQLRVKNLATNEEVACTVADVSPSGNEAAQVGIAFSKPSPAFWRVTFPPEDWSPHSVEARRASQKRPELVKK